MNTLTISKELAKKGELVVLSRDEYEGLLGLKKIREFTPTKAQKRALARARRNHSRGNYLTLNELKTKLGIEH